MSSLSLTSSLFTRLNSGLGASSRRGHDTGWRWRIEVKMVEKAKEFAISIDMFSNTWDILKSRRENDMFSDDVRLKWTNWFYELVHRDGNGIFPKYSRATRCEFNYSRRVASHWCSNYVEKSASRHTLIRSASSWLLHSPPNTPIDIRVFRIARTHFPLRRIYNRSRS